MHLEDSAVFLRKGGYMSVHSLRHCLLRVAGLLLVLAVLAGCGVGLVVGSGKTVTEERAISGVDGVALTFVGDLRIKQGDEEKLVITADDNVLPLITTEVNDGLLTIGSKSTLGIPVINDLHYDLTVRNLNSLQLSGAGSAQMDELKTGDLAVGVSGAGNLSIKDLQADRVTANLSGVGNLELGGKADRQTISLSGAGSYSGGDLETGSTDVTLSGLGGATVWATEKLNATISGAGNVEYYGNPDVTSKVSGLGNVTPQGNK
jgi:hypothetical protein